MPTTDDTKSWQHYRARIASLSRDRDADDPELAEARLNLRAARLAEHVRKVVDQAPPLTPAQRDRIAALLNAPRTADVA